MKYSEKVVVVTGAAAGIGRELALELLRRGARVAAVDLNEDGLRETADQAEPDAELSLHTIDITDRKRVEALPDAVIERHGAVDILINNAGIIQPFVTIENLDYEDIDRVINVDLYGPIYMTKTFLPLLLKRPEAYICNISSMGAFLPVPGQAIYGAAKAAVSLMTEALYAELLETDVGVSLVMPGAVGTEIASGAGLEMADVEEEDGGQRRSMAADKAAQIILDGIEDEKLHILVGSDARLMRLASRLAPKSSIRLIQRQMRDLINV